MSSSENEYTPQRVFDETVRHLASMRGPAMTTTKIMNIQSCAYRGTGGSRCAVGYWISDENYDPKIESTAVTDGSGSRQVQKCLPEPLQTRRMLSLLTELQRAHDSGANHVGDRWNRPGLIDDLREIARKRKLRVGVIKECFR
jgi:hypothetical protein